MLVPKQIIICNYLAAGWPSTSTINITITITSIVRSWPEEEEEDEDEDVLLGVLGGPR